MKIVISDTNIFIDLLNIDLFKKFLRLPMEIHTTDLVLSELKDEQAEVIEEHIKDKKITVITADEEEYSELIELMKERESISLVDYSVYYFAKKINATILTGDKTFKNYAEGKNMEVKGILWVLDEILNKKLLGKSDLAAKLRLLIETNKRIPVDECQQRLEKWE